MRSKRFLTLGVAALMVGACSGDGDAASTTATSGPGSTAAETVAETTTSTTVVETTTTTPPEPRFGVVVAREGVMGWWDGNRWVQAQDSAPLQGTEQFQVLGIGSEPAAAMGVSLTEGCVLDAPSVGVQLDPDPWGAEFGFEPFEPSPIAIAAPWDATPHPVVAFAPSDTHAEAAIEILTERGIDDPTPTFVQLLRTDIDGDGVNEVFAVVEQRTDQSGALIPAPAGDYSIAFVRTVVDDVVHTQVLAEWIVVDQSEEGFIQDLEVQRFGAFLDADGDGTDEVALRSSYYEGSGVTLWDLAAPGQFEPVISTGCGA